MIFLFDFIFNSTNLSKMFRFLIDATEFKSILVNDAKIKSIGRILLIGLKV